MVGVHQGQRGETLWSKPVTGGEWRWGGQAPAGAVETVMCTAFRVCGGLQICSKATTETHVFPRFHGRKHCWKNSFKTENGLETKNKYRKHNFRKTIILKQIDHRIVDIDVL